MDKLRSSAADSAAAIDKDESTGVECHTQAIRDAEAALEVFKQRAADLGPLLSEMTALVPRLTPFETIQFKPVVDLQDGIGKLQRGTTYTIRILERRITGAKRDLTTFLDGITKRREALRELHEQLDARDERELARFTDLLQRTGVTLGPKKAAR